MRFSTTIELGGKTATGFEVPADVVAALGHGQRVPVYVQLNGYAYRSTVAVMGGRFLVPLSAEHRTAAGLAAGDAVEVELTVDDTPRTVELPDELVAAFTAEPSLADAFAALSSSRQREHVRQVTSAKQPQTRERRVAAVLAALRS